MKPSEKLKTAIALYCASVFYIIVALVSVAVAGTGFLVCFLLILAGLVALAFAFSLLAADAKDEARIDLAEKFKAEAKRYG